MVSKRYYICNDRVGGGLIVRPDKFTTPNNKVIGPFGSHGEATFTMVRVYGSQPPHLRQLKKAIMESKAKLESQAKLDKPMESAKLDKPVKSLDDMCDYDAARKFAKTNRKSKGEVGNLARAFLSNESDTKMADACMAKADMWLSRARG